MFHILIRIVLNLVPVFFYVKGHSLEAAALCFVTTHLTLEGRAYFHLPTFKHNVVGAKLLLLIGGPSFGLPIEKDASMHTPRT